MKSLHPFISICIPAYKNSEYLVTLLASIQSQTFTDFEVIVTDDSPTNELEQICSDFGQKFHLRYYRNIPALGSPGNWNAGILKAKGDWIKIMHDDDWFSSDHALEKFAIHARQQDVDFIFSAYNNFENGILKSTSINSVGIIQALRKNPLRLFIKNYIGHPSTTLIKNNRKEWYDEKTKWVVDFEFYIRCLRNSEIYYISETLVNIGVNNEQITKQVFRNRAVEIPENIYLLSKLGSPVLHDIWVYDYYWRMFRNLKIRSIGEVLNELDGMGLQKELEQMLKFQLKIPLSILNMGIFSKFFMFCSYLLYRNR